MQKETGALDVYFEDSIEILVTDPDAFSEEEVASVLKAHDVAFSTIEPSEPF